MTYNEMYARLDEIKAFAKARQRVQDKRSKSLSLLCEQLDDAYRVCCVVKNHLQVAERYDKERKGK